MNSITATVQPRSWGSSNSSGNKFVVTVLDGFDDLTASLFDINGKPNGKKYALCLVELEDDGTLPDKPKPVTSGDFGDAAKLLYYSPDGSLAAIENPRFLSMFGTDADYQRFCREQGCSATGEQGEGQIVYAHVRRAQNSGIGIKPDYWGIPLWSSEHEAQHQQGEVSTFGSKDFMTKQRHKFVSRWIASKFGQASLSHVDPYLLCQYADKCGGIAHVGMSYRRKGGWV